MMLTALPSWLLADVDHIVQIIRERTSARAAVISIAGSQLLTAKREPIHAALVLLAAQFGTYRRERVQHAAAAAELIYAATQTHDALVDEGERRRGQHRTGTWEHPVALMVGDYLFALAAGEMALSPDARVINFYSQAVMRITEGTLMPPPPLFPLEQGCQQHFTRIRDTHAALYGAACRAGGACAGASTEQIEALGVFGEELGLALRLTQELHMFTTSNSEQQPITTMSLPLIFAAAQTDHARLLAALDTAAPNEQAWLRSTVQRYGLEPTQSEVRRIISQAHKMLEHLPAHAGRDLLAQLSVAVAHQSI
ncbi:polyprenyl synthetase family protein [Candidatus Viridilinea mediisalina]|uniref:Polyprenyl synthetase n=1 Tax=Candidatus Viridilinea mediisalina TaxID=2024553 RepID=A0A2A6RH29_9CHLR|nr:polyprenyl synthetase family protein [Candidatus Viridilinea mediisalina]PDW02189.1 hypothetical protein CJ255_15185 [Candidatus Viridilinea mediisalina]